MASTPEHQVEFGFLDEHIGFQIHLSRRAIWHSIRSRHRLDGGKLPSGYRTALTVIGLNPGIAPKRLAASLYLDPQATASILDRLEQDGFAIRQRSSTDKRRVELYLSDKGQAELDWIKARSDEQEAHLSRNLSTDERALLVEMLIRLRVGLEAPQD